MLLPRHRAAAATCACLVLTATAAHARTHTDSASFYSTGRLTANGERFDKTALKAAHRTLPFGSIVKVVNEHNGRSVVVEINDRGPAKWTRRTIDLTHEAAKRIGMVKRGVVPVRLEVAHVTRRQLDRAFLKLDRLRAARVAAEAAAARAEVVPETPSQSGTFQLASAIATEVARPIGTLGNIFKTYVESLIVPAGPHVNLTCPDGQPFPEPLRAVLRRAALEFDGTVEVLSGYRSLAYNRHVYGNRRKGKGKARYRGDGSQHIRCKAADFRIAGVNPAKLYAWAVRQPELGGIGRYRDAFIHVDIRPRPEGRLVKWDWRNKRKVARKKSNNRHARATWSKSRSL